MATKKTQTKPKAGAADFSALMNPRPVAREDVTEKELAFLGTVRHFAKLGFDLLKYPGLIFGGEEQCRSPEDRIAGELASESAETFDRLLKDGVNFAHVPRLMGMFMVNFQFQDAKRRNKWKKQFFADWDPANKKRRRSLLAGIVLNMYGTRRSHGEGAKKAMGEIQRMLDSPPVPQPPRALLLGEELLILKKYAVPGARVETLLDLARGQLGLRTTPKRPRVKRKRPEIA